MAPDHQRTTPQGGAPRSIRARRNLIPAICLAPAADWRDRRPMRISRLASCTDFSFTGP